MEMIKNEHKQELHTKVLERETQLKASLAGLQTDPENAKSDRARAVEEALAALQTHLTGGWDKVDESGSAALTRWLETSQNFVDTKVAPAPAAPPTVEPKA